MKINGATSQYTWKELAQLEALLSLHQHSIDDIMEACEDLSHEEIAARNDIYLKDLTEDKIFEQLEKEVTPTLLDVIDSEQFQNFAQQYQVPTDSIRENIENGLVEVKYWATGNTATH